MKTLAVRLNPLGKEIQTKEGSPLIDILHEYGVEFPCGGQGTCGKCKVKVLQGEIETNQSHQDKLKELDLGVEWRLACLSTCSTDLVLEIGQYESIIQADESSFEFTPGHGFGIAFDLGTTTLVGQLLDLSTGKILAVETGLNPQKIYGSDLITRMETSLRNGGEEMTRIIRAKLGEMVEMMMVGRQRTLDRMVIIGNSVMQHFFCGYDVTPLSFYPFESPHIEMAHFTSEDLGWKNVACRHVRFYPSIESFVGSDILAGIFATGMHMKAEYSLLIDLGTNGEIVLGNHHRLLCASTAAGPAFEGAKISQGMQATTGAISSILPDKDGWKCRVIGNGESKGICGSGLIDAVSILLEKGLLAQYGEIVSGESQIELDTKVKLSQKDIQEFQLAKAAIATGIEILLGKAGIGYHDVKDVYIAGGFGSYINLENVIRVGMLVFPEEIMHKLGNSALIGGKMFLFEDKKLPEEILKITEHVSLEADPDFQDIFIESLAFTGFESKCK